MSNKARALQMEFDMMLEMNRINIRLVNKLAYSASDIMLVVGRMKDVSDV